MAGLGGGGGGWGGVLGLHWPKLQNDGFYWPKLQKDSYWTNHHRSNGNVVLKGTVYHELSSDVYSVNKFLLGRLRRQFHYELYNAFIVFDYLFKS